MLFVNAGWADDETVDVAVGPPVHFFEFYMKIIRNYKALFLFITAAAASGMICVCVSIGKPLMIGWERPKVTSLTEYWSRFMK